MDPGLKIAGVTTRRVIAVTKKKGVNKGENVPPYTEEEKASSSVAFVFSFCL